METHGKKQPFFLEGCGIKSLLYTMKWVLSWDSLTFSSNSFFEQNYFWWSENIHQKHLHMIFFIDNWEPPDFQLTCLFYSLWLQTPHIFWTGVLLFNEKLKFSTQNFDKTTKLMFAADSWQELLCFFWLALTLYVISLRNGESDIWWKDITFRVL